MQDGTVILAISDPVRKGTMWPLRGRSNLRMIINMLKFQHGPSVELELLPPSDGSSVSSEGSAAGECVVHAACQAPAMQSCLQGGCNQSQPATCFLYPALWSSLGQPSQHHLPQDESLLIREHLQADTVLCSCQTHSSSTYRKLTRGRIRQMCRGGGASSVKTVSPLACTDMPAGL